MHVSDTSRDRGLFQAVFTTRSRANDDSLRLFDRRTLDGVGDNATDDGNSDENERHHEDFHSMGNENGCSRTLRMTGKTGSSRDEDVFIPDHGKIGMVTHVLVSLQRGIDTRANL